MFSNTCACTLTVSRLREGSYFFFYNHKEAQFNGLVKFSDPVMVIHKVSMISGSITQKVHLQGVSHLIVW